MILYGLGSYSSAADAYVQTYAATGSMSQAEAASRSWTPAPAPVAYYAPTPVMTNTPVTTTPVAPAPIAPAPIVDTTPTRQTIQPVTNTTDVVNTPPPAIIPASNIPALKESAPTVNPVIPNVSYNYSDPQVQLTQGAAGAGVDVPAEYTATDVVATPEAPAVSSASIPWGLILSLGFAAYESISK